MDRVKGGEGVERAKRMEGAVEARIFYGGPFLEISNIFEN